MLQVHASVWPTETDISPSRYQPEPLNINYHLPEGKKLK